MLGKVQPMKRCANCLHRWYVNSVWRCGKEAVSQSTVEAARAEGGDCGPTATHYLEDEDRVDDDRR